MNIRFDEHGTAENLKKMIDEVESIDGISSILILACDGNNFNSETIDPIILNRKTPLFGGIFPEVIYESNNYTKGTIVAGCSSFTSVSVVKDLSNSEVDYEEDIDNVVPGSVQARTMFVFVDGLAKRISSFIDSLFNVFGLDMNYLGGGAGSLSFEQKPVLFSNQGLLKDAAIIALTDVESGVGVKHGWEDVKGPFRVTKAEQNVIISLDWRPAADIYKEVVEPHSGNSLNPDNFFDTSKGYPFGISKLGSEMIVRDPISMNPDGSLVCVGEVPENVFVHILTGSTKTLVDAAKEALDFGEKNLDEKSQRETVFVIDCISRVLYLQDNFKQELDAISLENIPMIGALTLGEIANSGRDYLEFYNKTCVIGVLGS